MDLLRLFVYGTLKRGYWIHDAFCRGALEIREAQVRGRLYEGPGFPILEVPDGDVLALGTADPLADARAVPASTGACWYPPRWTAPASPPGSTRSKRPASSGAGSCPAAGRSSG